MFLDIKADYNAALPGSRKFAREHPSVLELQPQSPFGELYQRRHLSAWRDQITHQIAAADLVLGEHDGGHKVLTVDQRGLSLSYNFSGWDSKGGISNST